MYVTISFTHFRYIKAIPFYTLFIWKIHLVWYYFQTEWIELLTSEFNKTCSQKVHEICMSPSNLCAFLLDKGIEGWWLKLAWPGTPSGNVSILYEFKRRMKWQQAAVCVYITPEQTSQERRGKFQGKAVNCFNSFRLEYHEVKYLNIKCCGLNKTDGFMWELLGEVQA